MSVSSSLYVRDGGGSTHRLHIPVFCDKLEPVREALRARELADRERTQVLHAHATISLWSRTNKGFSVAEGGRRTYAVVDDVGLLRRRLNVRHRRVEPHVTVEPSVEARPEAFARGRGERIRALPLPVDVLEVYTVKPSMNLHLGCGMREGAYLDSPRWASAVY